MNSSIYVINKISRDCLLESSFQVNQEGFSEKPNLMNSFFFQTNRNFFKLGMKNYSIIKIGLILVYQNQLGIVFCVMNHEQNFKFSACNHYYVQLIFHIQQNIFQKWHICSLFIFKINKVYHLFCFSRLKFSKYN